MGKEQPASYYDKAYQKSEGYKRHYTKSHYFPMWNDVIKKLYPARPVLDIGCGVGQFAHMLWDRGFRNYVGIDFSTTALENARGLVPETKEFFFQRMDIVKGPIFHSDPSVQIVCMETLEHITEDVGLLNKLAKNIPGASILITVPTFDDIAHVRYFRTLNEVKLRYSMIKNATVYSFSRWIVLYGNL